MKFSEDILKSLNLDVQEERVPVNVMKVSELLAFLKMCAERIVRKSDQYYKEDDVEIRMDCMDIVTAKLNDFTQAFKDLVIFMRKQEGSYRGGESLRYCINSYDTFGFNQSEQERTFLKELLLRNEITHDYFNRELHQQKLVWIMQNCANGAVDLYENLYQYCQKNNLMEKYIEKTK